jgi:AbrB family looped-hinge helix DNA binding protein
LYCPSAAVRITTKGQVTIPLDVRERLGLLPHTEVQFRVEGRVAVLEKVPGAGERGAEIVRRMRGSAPVRMTTDDILALTRESP